MTETQTWGLVTPQASQAMSTGYLVHHPGIAEEHTCYYRYAGPGTSGKTVNTSSAIFRPEDYHLGNLWATVQHTQSLCICT